MAIPSKMQDRGNTFRVPGTSGMRMMIQACVVFFLMCFLFHVLFFFFMHRRKVDFGESVPQVAPVHGVVLSLSPERFSHAKQVIAQLGIPVVHKLPPSFQSQEVAHSMEFFGSRQFHSDTNLKKWTNRMAFVAESNTTASSKRWRFFFENDLAMHPTVKTSEHAKVLLAKVLEVAEEDGFVYLGVCRPTCEDHQVLDKHVEIARRAGTCAHAFGFQPWAAAKFINKMSELKLNSLAFDGYLLNYGRHVKKVWVLGTNLRSPVVGNHIGLLYQNRLLFPTSRDFVSQ